MKKDAVEGILWKDRKRTFLGLPWSFTRYSVTKERLLISTGFFNIKDDEVRLYRVMDISLGRTLGQRIFNVGTIKFCSADKTLGDFELINVKNPIQTKELISRLVEDQREIKRVVNRENMIDGHDMHDDDMQENGVFDHDDAPFEN